MNKSDFRRKLLGWYDVNKRDLPWRNSMDPYHIWLSEVMLQQTQVVTVIPYYRRFIKAFPTISALAQADQRSVLKHWEGLGYYARARNFHKAAQLLCAGEGCAVPDNYATFLQLPGVGSYIAAAVQSIAFRKPYAAVDGNVKRVLARLYADPIPVNVAQSTAHYQQVADGLLDSDHPGEYNQALMEIGALLCRPPQPACNLCPLQEHCRAFQNQAQSGFPKRKPRKKTPVHRLAAGVVLAGGKLLIKQRPEHGLLGGLWEFPAGRIDENETPPAACVRNVEEETGLNVVVLSQISSVKHAYTHFRIEMDVFLCTLRGGNTAPGNCTDCRWISPAEINEFPFSKANHKFIPAMIEQLNDVNGKAG